MAERKLPDAERENRLFIDINKIICPLKFNIKEVIKLLFVKKRIVT